MFNTGEDKSEYWQENTTYYKSGLLDNVANVQLKKEKTYTHSHMPSNHINAYSKLRLLDIIINKNMKLQVVHKWNTFKNYSLIYTATCYHLVTLTAFPQISSMF